MSETTTCFCCSGDPDLVCGACGEHSCWAGWSMCEESITAGVVHRDQYYAGVQTVEEKTDA